MRIKADFCEFLREGKILKLSLGLARASVVEFLGLPPDWSENGSEGTVETTRGFYYGGCRIYFEDNQVSTVTIPMYPEGAPLFDWGQSFPEGEYRINEFQDWLTEHNIFFRDPYPAESKISFAAIITEGGVSVCALRKAKYVPSADGSIEIVMGEDRMVDAFVLQKMSRALFD